MFTVSKRFDASGRRKRQTACLPTVLTSVLVFLFLPPSPLRGFEPFRVDVTQESLPETSTDIDHLVPIYGPIREFDYLAQYWAQLTDKEHHYVVVVRSASNKRYYIETGSPPKHNLFGQSYPFKKQIEISEETASTIYEFWANVLLETRPDRRMAPFLLGAPLYTFSTFIRGLGYIHGQAVTAEYPNIPPRWMVEAGEDLYVFVTKMPHDENGLRDKIKTRRDKFYEYMKTHPCPK